MPPPTFGQKAEALDKALQLCAQNGVTSITDPGIDVGDKALYMGAVDNGTFTLRSTQCGSAPTPTASARTARPAVAPKIHRYKDRFSAEAVKFFLDGALGSWGAAMLQNYSDRQHEHGQMRMSAAQFRANVTAWAKAGYQVATHAIGDAANRLALDVYSSICDAAAEADESCDAAPDLRLRIEHFQIVNESDVSRVTYPGTNASRACILRRCSRRTPPPTWSLPRAGWPRAAQGRVRVAVGRRLGRRRAPVCPTGPPWGRCRRCWGCTPR